MSQFGTMVRRLRLEKGLTLDELAGRLGSYKSYVWQIEAGRVNPPSVKFIHRYARLFRCDPKELVRLAYLDKAPDLIRDELRNHLLTAVSRDDEPKDGRSQTVPLLNGVMHPYSAQSDFTGRLESFLPGVSIVHSLPIAPAYAITINDDAMTRPESPSFPRGSIVLLHGAAEIETGRTGYVVYGTPAGRVASFRHVARLRGSDIHLEPFRATAPPQIVPLDEILGFHAVAGILGEEPLPPPNRV